MAYTSDGQPVGIVTLVADYPYVFVVSLIFVCCAITRLTTALPTGHHDPKHEGGAVRRAGLVPYWIPFIGHTISFGMGMDHYLQKVSTRIQSGVFALKVGGSTFNIVVSPSLTREILARSNVPVDNEDVIWRFTKLVFGDGDYFKEWSKKEPSSFWTTTKILHNLGKEPFLSEAISGTVRAVEDGAWNLISGNPSWVDHSRWERAGRVEIVSANSNKGGFVAEADFFALTKNFVGDVAVTVLMGHSFLENNPGFLDDFWLFDAKTTTLMTGLPNWMLPGVPQAVAARERLVTAIKEHHLAMELLLEGKDPESRWSDVNDASSLVWDRVKAFNRYAIPKRYYGVADLILLWTANINANQVVFWMLFYIYQDAELLSQIRAEISRYVSVRRPVTDLPIREAPKLSIDIAGLFTSCPLLKGAFFETMRLEVGPISMRVATADFVMSESKEDAARVGKSKPDKYFIKKGEVVSIPAMVQQKSALYYDAPEKFNARRFWVKKQDEKGNESVSVEYGFLRSWGGGEKMCKGRAWAEREVLTFVAGILMVWDMEPVSKNGWQHPGSVPTGGTTRPKKDVRVRMFRREI